MKITDSKSLGQSIRERRKELGYTQKYLSEYTGLSITFISQLERGKPTEIDYFNGYIAAKGRECGVATPVNDALTAMVKAIERGELAISTDNLSAPAFRALRY